MEYYNPQKEDLRLRAEQAKLDSEATQRLARVFISYI